MTMIFPCSLLLLVLALPQASAQPGPPQEARDWRHYWRVSHYEPAGMECLDRPETGEGRLVRYLYFKEPLYLEERKSGWARVTTQDGQSCWFPLRRMEQMHNNPVLCPGQSPPMTPLPLSDLADADELESSKAVRSGRFFPTFYQIAREELHPPKKGEKLVELRDGKGKTIARVSPAFRRALNMQGTAMLVDGRVLNVGRKVKGQRRYVVLPRGHFGLGVAGRTIQPYRSVALDFDLLCERLAGVAGCTRGNALPREARDRGVSRKNRRKLVGMLLYLPAFKGVLMPGGVTHDGFVCAVDVGGGIKFDRMDIFVGTDGGGNPYYPECRRENALTRAGIMSLIPSDWRHFSKQGSDYARVLQTEYRQVSPHKGLEILAYPDVKCDVKR